MPAEWYTATVHLRLRTRAMYRLFACALALAVGCGVRGDDERATISGDASSSETTGARTPTEDPPPVSCPASRESGPYALPEAVLGEPYDIHLAEYALGSLYGVDPTPEGVAPPGLMFELGPRLVGTPTILGSFKFGIVTVEHWVPRGCPGVSYITWFSVVVVVDSASGSGGWGSSSTDSGGE